MNDPCDDMPLHVAREMAGLQSCGCPRRPALCRCVTAHSSPPSPLGPINYGFETAHPLCGRRIPRAPGCP